jgi:hypothetical protein
MLFVVACQTVAVIPSLVIQDEVKNLLPEVLAIPLVVQDEAIPFEVVWQTEFLPWVMVQGIPSWCLALVKLKLKQAVQVQAKDSGHQV